jgi:hypothetical protein
MSIYFAVLTIPLMLSWGRPSIKCGISIGLFAYFLVLLVFVGFRYEIGPDWGGYANIFLSTRYFEFADGLALREPGFFALNRVSDLLGFGLQGVMFVCALVFLIGIFAYATQTASAWMAVAVVTPYLIFVIAMSGIRQAAAMGIIYFLLSRWTKFGFITKLILIMGAATVHNSALCALLLLMFEERKWLWAKILFTGLLVWYLMSAETVTATINYYQTDYVEKNLASNGAFFHVLLSAFPGALFLYNRRRIAAAGWANPQVAAGSLAAILALPLLMVSSTGVDRLALYLSYVQMWAYPALVATFAGTHRNWTKRENWLAMISSIIMVVFLGFFIFGNHSEAYVPYKNVLMED